MRRGTQLAIPLGLLLIVLMLVVPLPAGLIDFLIALNITLALLVLLVSVFVKRPLEFAVFPSVLLVLTIFRLALNISSTRLILIDADAGKVIDTFGHFVIGGSLVVGLIVFAILVVIQFVVITNGAGRVAEVGARFTLDAMPGKQMAIDADLNSGLIGETEARKRRREVSAEAEFYGAMDGASKFVKGDAIAAIIIVLVNLIGGFAIGVLQKGMSVADAGTTYALLSVGDGLVSQVPALLLSVATGLIVTRSSAEEDLSVDVMKQFGANKLPLQISGVAVIALCLIIPSMPKLPFLIIGAALLFFASQLREDTGEEVVEVEENLGPIEDTAHTMVAAAQVDPLRLELSAQIVDLVDPTTGGDLLDRVKALRKKIADDLGIVMPRVRTRDNLSLEPGVYMLSLYGVEVARGLAPAGCVLAVGDDLADLPGPEVTEPVFGLPGKWIPKEMRAQAEVRGFTVIDRSALITTHLADVVRKHASRLLGREEVKILVDVVKETHPTVIDELTPAQLSLGEIQRVLQSLLIEEVPIKDLVGIFEALSLKARETKESEALTEAVRLSLGPAVANPYVLDGELRVVSFDPRLEQRMLEMLRPSDDGPVIALDPDTATHIMNEVARHAGSEEQPVIVCAPQLRSAVRRFVEVSGQRVPVLSYRELPKNAAITSVGVISALVAGEIG